jgi:hypothetical protein
MWMEEGLDSVTSVERLADHNPTRTTMQHRFYSGPRYLAVIHQENTDQAAPFISPKFQKYAAVAIRQPSMSC